MDYTFIKACSMGNLTSVRELIERGYTFKIAWEGIMTAVRCGHLEVVKYLVENTLCDPINDDNEAIKQASSQGHLDIVRYLYEKCGCDPTSEHNIAIKWAIINGHLDVVKYLISVGCDPRGRRNWVIVQASINGHYTVIEYLRSIDYSGELCKVRRRTHKRRTIK